MDSHVNKPRSSAAAAASSSSSCRLLAVSPLEPRDEMEDRHDRCYQMVVDLTADRGEKEANDALAQAVSANPKQHEDVCVGLIAGILRDPERAARHYRDLSLVSRDGLAAACSHVTAIVLDKYPRLMQAARVQLLWLAKEMIRGSVGGMENVCWNLMRQIAGGDTSNNNLWLANQLLETFVEHRIWLERFPFLLASVVYTYLRIMEDHFGVPQLLAKEVHFIVGLVRDRFSDVTVIGRDLVRVLQNVSRIPEIQRLWLDLVHHPRSLSPTFTGIGQLMHTRTSRRFLQSRITPEMEKKLVFLTTSVRFGTHKRYQDWFQRQYLSTNESQSLRCDLIRFIVGVIHPTNELLGSDIIPRWAIIGWLLTTCTNQVASSNAKLALFYDWLFFTPDKDNIMNIEPAILVMHHSMRPHPAITATLLDFLCRIVSNFLPGEKDRVHAGVSNSLRMIVDKRVLPSLQPLFDNPRLDEELRSMLRERFPQFANKEDSALPPLLDREDTTPTTRKEGGEETPLLKFSDDEDEEESEKKSKQIADSPEDIDEDIKSLILELEATKDLEKKCEVVDSILKAATVEDYEFEQCSVLASRLAEVLHIEFQDKVYPSGKKVNRQALEDSIGRPVFVIFRSLCEMTEGDGNDTQRNIILTLLAEMYTLQPRVGYYLLYFLSCDGDRTAKEKGGIYKDLCEAIDEKYSLDICLVNDMRQCVEDDVSMFVHLVPEVFSNFPKHSVGNTDLLYLVVSCVDGGHIERLVCGVIKKEYVLFKRDSFANVVNASLAWETFEQYALWQLASAHDLPVDWMSSVVPKLENNKDQEAQTFILLRLRQEKPTADLIKALLARPPDENDRLMATAFIAWINSDHEERLSDLLSTHLTRQLSHGTGKRKRNQPDTSVSSLPHSAELSLTHLDNLKKNLTRETDFFSYNTLQSSLQTAKAVCTEAQKRRLMELFSAIEEDSDVSEHETRSPAKRAKSSGSNNSKSPAKGKQAKMSSSKKELSDSSAFSSEEDSDEEALASSTRRGSSKTSRSRTSKTAARKRAGKVSYKISSEDSSEDNEIAFNNTKKGVKKKKRAANNHPSDSE